MGVGAVVRVHCTFQAILPPYLRPPACHPSTHPLSLCLAPACLPAHLPACHPTTPQVPIRTLVVNQVLQPGLAAKYLQTRRADQQRSLVRLREDAELGQLQVIEAPLFDLEVRGVPALTYFGQQVWK
jgi:hypothetical protein